VESKRGVQMRTAGSPLMTDPFTSPTPLGSFGGEGAGREDLPEKKAYQGSRDLTDSKLSREKKSPKPLGPGNGFSSENTKTKGGREKK